MYIRLKPVAAMLLPLFATSLQAQNSLDTIVVTATRQESRTSELLSDITILDRQDIERAGPRASIADLLAQQPGIEIKTDGNRSSSSIYIRGSNAGHALLLIDGVRVGSATLGTANWGFLPLEQIERIEVLRGSASSLYGSDAIGGVIQVFTRRGDGPLKLNGEAGLGSHNLRFMTAGLSRSNDAWRYSLNIADNRTDGINAISNPANFAYNKDRDGYKSSSISGNLSYRFAKDQEAGLSLLHTQGRSEYDASWPTLASDDYYRKQQLSSFNLHSRNRLGANWMSTIRLGRSIDDAREFTNGARTTEIRTQQTQYQWQNDISLSVGKALLAVERLEQKVSGSQVYAKDKINIDSLVLGWHGNLDKHRLQLNLRHDDNSQFGNKNTGFIAYGYQITPNLRGHASYGTAFKAPSFNDLYWPGSGNPNLKPETAKNKEVSLHYEHLGHHYSATYYQNDVKDLIAWAPIAPGSWIWAPKNINAAKLRGLTLAYDGNIHGFKVAASADFQDPKDTVLDKTLRYRSRQHAKASIGREHGRLDWRLEWQASGKRYQNEANTQKLGGYALFNVHTSYRVHPEWSVFARINNLFDRKYVLNQDYSTDGLNGFIGIRYTPK